MFLHHPSKFGEFSLKIGGEIICQSWPLLTPFFNFRIVQCEIMQKNQWKGLNDQIHRFCKGNQLRGAKTPEN